MSKELMISIRPEHAINISRGKKTLELRTWIPKKYVGWVNVYITKAPPTIAHFKWDTGVVNWELNGKVAFRFWFETYETFNPKLGHPRLYINACVSDNTVASMFRYKDKAYAWHINKLEIFDKPLELSDFFHYKKKLIDCDDVKVGLTKAPQKMVWVCRKDI